ncbi:MAG: hypothetical protein U0K68_10395 [Agathobacter sp.]|nr:hypothetical protein [Agathobacter sp.]
MSINSVSGVSATPTTSTVSAKTKTKAETTTKKNFDDTAAVYEKSEQVKDQSSVKVRDNSAIIEQLKADAQARKEQLIAIVRQSMGGQASASWTASKGLKSLFENLKVDQATINQAKKDTAEDGYWGVKQTSDRILDFAKALSGGDPSKADELLNAFKKGFEQATRAWGDKLPQLCQDTYDAVVEKFTAWKNGQ